MAGTLIYFTIDGTDCDRLCENCAGGTAEHGQSRIRERSVSSVTGRIRGRGFVGVGRWFGDSGTCIRCSFCTKHFTNYINEEPAGFWDEAIDTVRESAGFDSDFYLTEGGLVFYYSPYDLACYAAGFQQVTIPYSEFDIKIPIDAYNNSDGLSISCR